MFYLAIFQTFQSFNISKTSNTSLIEQVSPWPCGEATDYRGQLAYNLWFQRKMQQCSLDHKILEIFLSSKSYNFFPSILQYEKHKILAGNEKGKEGWTRGRHQGKCLKGFKDNGDF